MQDLGIGKLIPVGADVSRDAIHIAVAPVVVVGPQFLWPGERIKLTSPGSDKVRAAKGKDDAVGIVDPFLPSEGLEPGQRFWMFLLPNTITSLRHDWTHPAFTTSEVDPKTVQCSASEQWLRKFAELQADITYNELMTGARDFLDSGEYLCDGGKWEGFYIPDIFWFHYESVTGVEVPEDKKTTFFTCAC